MSTNNNDGGPAFPVDATYNPDGSVWYHGKDGMTLRDWFAGQALNSMRGVVGNNPETLKWAADEAYKLADAMLAARTQP